MLNHPKSSKWDNQGAIIFHSLLNPRKIQQKLGTLGDDLDSSGNTNAIQKAVKKFTEITSKCGDKTLRTKSRSKINKRQKNLDIVGTVPFL